MISEFAAAVPDDGRGARCARECKARMTRVKPPRGNRECATQRRLAQERGACSRALNARLLRSEIDTRQPTMLCEKHR